MKATDSSAYLQALLNAPRPGTENILAFYEHRVGMICTDPRLLLCPLDDHLCHRGDGIFESISFRDRRIFRLDAHMERMRRSAAGLQLTPPCPWEELRCRILDVAAAGNEPAGGIRVLLGRGPGGFGVPTTECPVSSLYIIAIRRLPPAEEVYRKGYSAVASAVPAKQGYLARTKNVDYLPNVLMAEEARTKGADISISFDADGCLGEAPVGNIAVVSADGTLVCPEFTHILPGTTVIRAMELAAEHMPVEQRPVTAAEIAQAREILYFSSTPLCLAVTSFDGRPVGDGKPGPTALRLKDELLAALTAEGTPF